jgi:mannose-6-phosphate isomerase-like protein (cupin superfamily)
MTKKRTPFKKNVPGIEAEKAFGGVGRTRTVLSEGDPISPHLKSLSHGIVKPDSVAGWYEYPEDLIIVVISGKGELMWRSGGGLSIQSGDVAYIPALEQYRLDNPSPQEFEAIFVRIAVPTER